MFERIQRAAALVALFTLPVAGCAHAHDSRGGPHSQVLAELPADAPPGECYARVKVPGEPVGPPPVTQGTRWVLTPGPVGSPGPIWCLVPTGPVQVAAPVETIARYGWIQVLCDRDATPERIGRIQRRLHDRGYYRGEYSGRYDSDTAEAISRFQSGARIGHGGYLSLETLDALDADQDGYGDRADAGYSYSSGYDRQSSSTYGTSGYAYGYPGPVSPCAQPCGPAYAPTPPVFQQPPAYPCCVAPQVYSPPCCAPQPYGYGTPTPPYAAYGYYGYGSRSAVQNGWLTWNGKTRY